MQPTVAKPYKGYRDIKIKLDGTEITPKDANGKTVEPFIIDGTTYLPVRAVGEAMGLDVDWDGETSIVQLEDKNSGIINVVQKTMHYNETEYTLEIPQLFGSTEEIKTLNENIVDFCFAWVPAFGETDIRYALGVDGDKVFLKINDAR